MPSGGGDQFLPKQRAAAAFNQREAPVGFVRAIYRKVQRSCLCKIDDRNAKLLRLYSGSLGSRYPANLPAQPARLLPKPIDKVYCSTARSKTERHTVFHKLYCSQRGNLFWVQWGLLVKWAIGIGHSGNTSLALVSNS